MSPAPARRRLGAWALAIALATPLRAAPEAKEPAPACLSELATARAVDFLNLDLKEYGWVFEDARSARCAKSAARALTRKLEGTLRMGPRESFGSLRTLPFQGWLEGVHVELIHATALVLGGRGLLTPRLAALVGRGGAQYRYTRDPTCDPHSTTNTCFDDQSQAAAAEAWIGAFETLAGHAGRARAALDRAEELLHASFAPANFLCVAADGAALPVPCASIGSPAAALESDRFRVAVFNHGFEDMGYGVGLLTSFSSALLAFSVSGRPFAFSEEEKAVLGSIFRRGQEEALPDGSAFRADGCLEVRDGALRTGHPCADLGYTPRMFPVRLFTERLGGRPRDGLYGFDLFDPSLFSARDDFLHLGRSAVYGALARDWWDPAARPRLSAKVRPKR